MLELLRAWGTFSFFASLLLGFVLGAYWTYLYAPPVGGEWWPYIFALVVVGGALIGAFLATVFALLLFAGLLASYMSVKRVVKNE